MSEEEVYDLKERLICKGWEEAVDYIEELETELKEANDSIEWWTKRLAVERDKRELKDRIDKAIEYIKTLDYENEETYDISELARNELLEILQGSDKE